MFPIRWNEIFRKKDGTLGTMEDAGGSGSALPEYSSSDAGKVLSVDDEGALEWAPTSSGVEYRAGTQNANISAGSWNSFSINFSSPMPNTNYAIFLDPVNFATDFKFSNLSKTVNGISGRIDNLSTTEGHFFQVNYFAVANK